MSTDRSRSSTPNYGDAPETPNYGDSPETPNYGDSPETPKGIWGIATLGMIGAVISLFAGASGLLAGAISVPAGGLLIALGIAQGITMLALVGLTLWAWYATILLYLLSGGINLLQGDGIGMVVSLIVVAYVGVHRDLFED